MKRSRDTAHASAMPMQSLNEVFYQLLQAQECGTSTLAALRYADQDLQELITTHVLARVAHGNRYACREKRGLSVHRKSDNHSFAVMAVTYDAMLADPPYPPLLREEARRHAAWFALHATSSDLPREVKELIVETIANEHLHLRERTFAVSALSYRCFKTHDVVAALVRALRSCAPSIARLVQSIFHKHALQYVPRDHPDAAELVRQLIPHIEISGDYEEATLLRLARYFGLTSLLFDDLQSLLGGIANREIGFSVWEELMIFLARNAPNEDAARTLIGYLEPTFSERRDSRLSLLSLLRFRSCRERLLPLLSVCEPADLLQQVLNIIDGEGDADAVIQVLSNISFRDLYDVAVAVGTDRMVCVVPAVLASGYRLRRECVMAIAAAAATHGTAEQCDAMVEPLRAAYATKGDYYVTNLEALCWGAPQFRPVLLEQPTRWGGRARSEWFGALCSLGPAATEPIVEFLVSELERGENVEIAFRRLLHCSELACRTVVAHADRISKVLASEAVDRAKPRQLPWLFRCLLQSADVDDNAKLALVTGRGFKVAAVVEEGLRQLIEVVPSHLLRPALLALTTAPQCAAALFVLLTALASRSAEGAATVVNEHRDLVLRLAAELWPNPQLPLALAINGGSDGVALAREIVAKAKLTGKDRDYAPLMKLIA